MHEAPLHIRPQGYLARKNTPSPPQDHHRAPGMGLVQNTRRRRFRMSEAQGLLEQKVSTPVVEWT